MKVPEKYCPKEHGKMELKILKKKMTFKGVEMSLDVETYICPDCGLEAGTVEATGKLQQRMVDLYRKEHGWF